MVAHNFNVELIQKDAFSEIDKNCTEQEAWHSDPDGMSFVLNNHIGSSLAFKVDNFSSRDFQECLNRIYYTLKELSFPCITLVRAGGHWIVTDGLRVRQEKDGKAEILGVWIEDPWYGSSPHRFITVKEFKEGYLLPNKWGAKWKQKLVVITDSSAKQVIKAIGVEPELLIRTNDRAGEVIFGMEEFGFKNVKPVEQGGGAPLLTPIWVNSLSSQFESYRIIPADAIETEEFQDYIYVAADSRNNILEVTTLPKALDIFSDEEVLTRLHELFPQEKVHVAEGFYWKPCFELRSRFDVTKLVFVGGKKRYLLKTGEVIEHLTDFSEGGG
jgi:hypothetical protein